MRTIKSVLRGDKVAYRLNPDWNWERKGNAPLSIYLEEFETYGDGTTQHGGAYCVQWHNLTDLCISLTHAIIAEPTSEDWRILGRTVYTLRTDWIEFARKIQYKEGKEQYYSFQELKVSTAESKRHDKRWEVVQSWMDGSGPHVLSTLLNADPHRDNLAKLCVAWDVREVCGYYPWEDLFAPVKTLTGDWQHAFRAYRDAVHAVQLIDTAASCARSALHNSALIDEQNAIDAGLAEQKQAAA